MTELGLLPIEWSVVQAGDVCELVVDCKNRTPRTVEGGEFAVVRTPNVRGGKFVRNDLRFTDKKSFQIWTARAVPQVGDVLITREAPTGEVCAVPSDIPVCLGQRMMLFRPNKSSIYAPYLLNALMFKGTQEVLFKKIGGSTVGHAKVDDIRTIIIPLPPTEKEQQAIAHALADVEMLIEGLENLIAKKRSIKQGAMQELISGCRRLPSVNGCWRDSCIVDIADCLDHLRVPLNDADRQGMRGDYPYCGANGVLDFIDRYCLEDSVVLIAEDGGYFDEYETRPIAYRMIGKMWVNNHAHILKSKAWFDQDFLYYALVNKNILPFLASGTRAKLNKSELGKIVISHPVEKTEQTAIGTILSDLDLELDLLAARLAKVRRVKQGMMDELLTGMVRLT